MAPQAETLWATFLSRCLHNRIPPPEFSALVKTLHTRSPLPASSIATIFLKPRHPPGVGYDPLLVLYVEKLLGEELDILDVPAVLGALLKTSHLQYDESGLGPPPATGGSGPGGEDGEGGGGGRFENSIPYEEAILARCTRTLTAGFRPKTVVEVWGTLRETGRWMAGLVTADARDDLVERIDGTGTGGVSGEAMGLREGVGNLLLAVAESGRVLAVLGGGGVAAGMKDIRENYARSLSLFVPFLSQTSMALAARLEAFRKEYFSMFDGNQSKGNGGGDNALGVDVSALDIHGIDGEDRPIINSRAGLYIFLNSLLVGCPKVDDGMILNYLHNRYKSDVSMMAVDLIIAAFDILSNAMFRNENPQTITLLRSFLVNKVPLLLANLSTSMFPPLTSELCITQAFSHIDPQAFPSLGNMSFDLTSDNDFLQLDNVRSEFLYACCLHDLLPEQNIEGLLGDIPMDNLPPGGRYVTEQLVAQCAIDPERVEGLLGEIEKLDGNAGAAVGAVTEVIHNLCESKETMSLKTICGFLARKPSSLDVMLIFSRPATVLQPVCQLLDTWKYEEDQDEYQPVYEEFGYILLFVLAIVFRYRLTPTDLGLQHNPDSFVHKLLRQGSVSHKIEDLTPNQHRQLGDWIRGIFDVEGGINDEIMASCPPQDFYLLVPTLFSQSITACAANIMDMDTLKGGLEYLRETFLITSLISALTHLTNLLWEHSSAGTQSQQMVDVIMSTLTALIKPKSISGEAELMLQTILSCTARPLEHSLRELRRVHPTRTDMDPLVLALGPYLSFKRTAGSHHTELESWSATPGGGILMALRTTIAGLVAWTPEINMTPATYTHRLPLVAIKLLGARSVLRAVLDEVQAQTQTGHGEIAVDVAVSLICAPGATDGLVPVGPEDMYASSQSPHQHVWRNASGRLNLREALQLEIDELPKISRKDPGRAELIVRLHRRVDAQLNGTFGAQNQMMAGLAVGNDGGVGTGVGDLGVGVGDVGGMDDVLGGDLLGGGDLFGEGDGMDLS